MGKGGKHKKHLKSERAKTKLKQKTKFLPKGLNVTKVDFKIKPIVLPEQLRKKSTDEGPLSKRKLNIHELLSRLKHHNVRVKCESLGELCAIASEHVEATQENLSGLLKASCTLLLDGDRDVRTATTKLLDVILRKVSPGKVEPFFDILLLHLQCCMTNIDARVQDTSLVFLDVLLNNTPQLIAACAKHLLRNFISLISVARNDSVLSVNVGNRLTSVRWRIRVLGRLQKILEAVSDSREEKTAIPDCPTFHASQTNTIAVYNNFYENPNCDGERSGDDLSAFVPVLIQLLYETWLEVTPEKKHKGSAVATLNEDAAAILSCVTTILFLLMRIVPQGDLYETSECEKLSGSLFGGFPYARAAGDSPKCTKENLTICAIFCATNKELKHRHLIERANDVVAYTERCMSNRNYVDQQNILLLTRVVRIILMDNAEGWSRKRVDIHKFVEKLLKYYTHCGNPGILKVLCDVYTKPYVNGIFKYQEWLGELPEVLTRKNISEDILNSLIDINRRKPLLFRRGIVKHLPQILENLPSLDKPKQFKVITLFSGMENFEEFYSIVRKNPQLLELTSSVTKSWYQLNCRSDCKRLHQNHPWFI